jgi:hypothetical protein
MASTANNDFVTDFEVDERSQTTLEIQHDKEPNRDIVMAGRTGSTEFQAKLEHVQYDNYDGQAAALLLFDMKFAFRNESVKRLTEATIELTFEETVGPDLSDPDPRNQSQKRPCGKGSQPGSGMR